MAISFEKAFGTYENAVQLRTQRASVLANNIANADTPNFRARDFNFHEVLKSRLDDASQSQQSMRSTQSGHQTGLLEPEAINGLQYRIPSAPAIDGNTVDAQREKVEYTQNSLEFQAAFNLLNGRVRGLMNAIKGQ